MRTRMEVELEFGDDLGEWDVNEAQLIVQRMNHRRVQTDPLWRLPTPEELECAQISGISGFDRKATYWGLITSLTAGFTDMSSGESATFDPSRSVLNHKHRLRLIRLIRVEAGKNWPS